MKTVTHFVLWVNTEYTSTFTDKEKNSCPAPGKSDDRLEDSQLKGTSIYKVKEHACSKINTEACITL